MKKSLLVVVALLCMASLMATMAFSTAMVTSKTLGAVVKTDAAFLALEENPNFTDFAKIDDKGNMVIDFTYGGTHGFQPNSNYTFNDLFYIKNNLADKDIKVGLRFDSTYVGQDWVPGLWRVEASRQLDGMPANDTQYNHALMRGQSAASDFSSGWLEGRYVILEPGESMPIDWLFSVGEQLGYTKTMTLQVHSEVIGR